MTLRILQQKMEMSSIPAADESPPPPPPPLHPPTPRGCSCHPMDTVTYNLRYPSLDDIDPLTLGCRPHTLRCRTSHLIRIFPPIHAVM